MTLVTFQLDNSATLRYIVGMMSKGTTKIEKQTGRVITLTDGSAIVVEQRADGSFAVYMLTRLGEPAFSFAATAESLDAAHAAAIRMADGYLSMGE